MKFLPYVVRSLWRHRSRTFLTVSGTAVSIFVLVVVLSVQEGLDRLTEGAQADRTLIVFQENRFCPSTSKLNEDYGDRIKKLPGVRDAVPVKLFMNNCRASLDVVVFMGLPPKKVQSNRDFELLEGSWPEFFGRQDAAIVGKDVAARRGLSVGQKFSIGSLSVVITGIYASQVPAENNFIYTHLEFLQRTPGLNSVGLVTQVEVTLDDEADSEAVCEAIDAMFRSGPVQTDTRPKGVFQSNAVGDLVELAGFLRYLGLACVALVLALVSTTTLMSVQDRIKEHAVLQTIGFSGPRVFLLVVLESLILSLIGGLVGIFAGEIILATSGLAIGTEGVMIAFLPSFAIAWMGLVASLVVGILGGLAPAIQAARAEIVPALRFA